MSVAIVWAVAAVVLGGATASGWLGLHGQIRRILSTNRVANNVSVKQI